MLKFHLMQLLMMEISILLFVKKFQNGIFHFLFINLMNGTIDKSNYVEIIRENKL